MSNNNLINLLRSGKQEPVKMSFNNIRTINQLAGFAGNHIEADSLSIIHLLNDNLFLSFFGYNKETAFAIFIPNTYEFLWNTNAEGFLKTNDIRESKVLEGIS